MVAHGEVVPLPFPLWLAATVLLASTHLLRWLVYRVVIGAGAREMLGAWVAGAALAHVISVANLWALAGRHVPWRRTDKFRPARRGAGALGAARTELILGLSCLTMA